MRSDREVEWAIDRYGDMVRRVCMLHLKNKEDMEDIFQNVFLKYALRDAAFESQEHEKAWLLRVSINSCKDLLKSLFRKNRVSLEDLMDQPAPQEGQTREVLEALLSLPAKYRRVVYLHYYEGYTAPEIGRILGKNTNTVYTHLNRAKEQLGILLGGEEFV